MNRNENSRIINIPFDKPFKNRSVTIFFSSLDDDDDDNDIKII